MAVGWGEHDDLHRTSDMRHATSDKRQCTSTFSCWLEAGGEPCALPNLLRRELLLPLLLVLRFAKLFRLPPNFEPLNRQLSTEKISPPAKHQMNRFAKPASQPRHQSHRL